MFVSIDGLRVHDIDTIDMDEFKEWLWPGVAVKYYMVEIYYISKFQVWPYVFNSPRLVDEDGVERLRQYWYRVWVRAVNKSQAGRKATRLVVRHLNPVLCPVS